MALYELIENNEDWLIDHIIDYAKHNGYFQYTPTLARAWRESIVGLNEELLTAIRCHAELLPMGADDDYRQDPFCQFALCSGRRHRARGVTLQLFLSLMKYFRKTYLDLVEISDFGRSTQARYRAFIERYFDRLEVALSADWATTEEAAAIAELTAKNRDLANEKDKYLTIFESIQDPVFILDNAGRIENMNAAAWRLLGINGEPGELYYRRDGQFPAREQIEAQLTDLSLQDNTTVTLQTPLGQRSFDIRRREILDIGNKYSGSVVIFNDVTTHLQALEKQAQANRIKTSFLATVSHEIRTPMNGILGAVHLLLDGSLSPQQQSYAEAIARSGKRLHAFINNVLDYSKIEAGRLELEISTFSISETLDNVIAIMAPQATELGLALHLDTSALPKTTVSGDPGKLQQVLLNLISNALKFTERGQVRVRVQLEPLDQFRFIVEDTGIGLGACTIERLFEPFTQFGGALADRDQGSGLGLAICRHLVEAMGGEIGAYPGTGKGSVFWFRVPLPQSVSTPLKTDENSEAPAIIPPLKLLLVEDDEINQLVTSGLLEREGHQVIIAGTGTDALRLISEAEPIDLILLDIRLPDMDGFEVARSIREHLAESIPIIAMTAHASAREVETGGPIDASIIKPFHPDELYRMLVCFAHAADSRCPDNDTLQVPLQLLDEAVLREHLIMLGCERTEKIINAFRQSCSKAMTDLLSTAASDHKRAAATAHRLRSACSGVGLQQLAQAAARVETAANEQADMTFYLADLKNKNEQSRQALEQFWQTISTPGIRAEASYSSEHYQTEFTRAANK